MDSDTLAASLRVGERVSVRFREPGGLRDVIGFVVSVDPLVLEDRHGKLTHVAEIQAGHLVGVPLGRDPLLAPRALLDDLAAPDGLVGEPVVHRISELVAETRPPSSVFTERGWWSDGTHTARVDGEWLTTSVSDPELLVRLAWWAARQNARSVQVRPLRIESPDPRGSL